MAEDAKSKVRILFVDDEEKSCKYFSIIFGREFDVLTAKDGQEGLEMALSGEHGEIGVVVTDQIMPRLTGLDLLEELVKHHPKITRVLSTAYTDSKLVSNAVESNLVDFFIAKPWKIEKLQSILERAVAHYEANKAQSEVA